MNSRGDLLGRIDIAARVVAQVEDDRGGAVVEQLRRAPSWNWSGLALAEAVQGDVADVAVEHLAGDFLGGDLGARDGQVEGPLAALAATA